MSKKLMLQNETPQERKRILRDNCYAVEKFNYSKPFTNEELLDIKDKYSQRSIEVQRVEQEKQNAVDAFKMQLKPILLERADLLEKIKNKAEQVSEDVFLMDDQENGVMDFINDAGETVYSRPLLPTEKQLKIKVAKTGTDN